MAFKDGRLNVDVMSVVCFELQYLHPGQLLMKARHLRAATIATSFTIFSRRLWSSLRTTWLVVIFRLVIKHFSFVFCISVINNNLFVYTLLS